MSRLDLLAGPNGAGKSTFYERIIEPDRPGLPFVNADRIAAAVFADPSPEDSYEAARRAQAARDALIDARIDFCTETVFSHHSKVDLITTAVVAGYDVVLSVLMIPVELSAHRVAARVGSGGHDVPVDKLAPRFHRIWPLIVDALPHCQQAVFYDNAADSGPSESASFRFGVPDYPPRWPAWAPEPLTALT